jgi:tRNA(Arg) A34 adenosine deaminase TadA/3-methyladenine DNA glycosylase Mpg
MSAADDELFMREALELAREAGQAGEIPVGAVVVRDGVVAGRGRNRREGGGGAVAHAETEAVTDACARLGGWRLGGCTLYVTLEPCPMCAGACLEARIGRIVFGAPDPRKGALGGLFDLASYPLGCRPLVTGGVLGDECAELLRGFFASRRTEAAELRRKTRRLQRSFYTERADLLAPALLGKYLCRRDRATGGVLKSRITETECYLGVSDTACHASSGMTDRNRVMWDKGGTVYVYLCYGIHNMLNVVSGQKGSPEAVLIRGTEGCPGPGRVTKAMGIDRSLNGSDLVLSDEIWIETDGGVIPEYDCLPRVGIDYASDIDRARPWRFVSREE